MRFAGGIARLEVFVCTDRAGRQSREEEKRGEREPPFTEHASREVVPPGPLEGSGGCLFLMNPWKLKIQTHESCPFRDLDS